MATNLRHNRANRELTVGLATQDLRRALDLVGTIADARRRSDLFARLAAAWESNDPDRILPTLGGITDDQIRAQTLGRLATVVTTRGLPMVP